ncbi:Protein dennd6a [Dermatophagoides farinae]|uniref:Protein dennd6a n=1 Tax=Dermatophagoides farinae TaxID=6954 RepID=A0A922L5C7_DERFA|nr:Protein dennd6a [Dermatophagoides farinae]
MEYSNESKLNLKFSTTTTTSNDNENDFTITPPLSHDEQIIINERMAIVGSENVDIIINDDDNVNNGCDNHHHHQNHGNNIDDLDDDDDKHYNKWIYCIAIVNFDIEIGQSIECIYPKHAQLTEKEMSNICYLSFPDSNSGCMGDTQFHFRTKCCQPQSSSLALATKTIRTKYECYYDEFNSKCLSLLQVDKSYFYGFVYFRQVKDRNVRRGYFQKSLVILTWFPFISFYQRIMKILAPKYFDFGLPSLEAAFGDINRWPPPETDQILNLPLFGTITSVLIPGERHSSSLNMCQTTTTTKSPIQNGIIKSSNSSHGSSSLLKTFSLRLSKKSKHHHYRHDNQHEESSSSSIDQSPSSSSSAQPLNVANDVNIYRNLLPIITHVQLLWELVLTNEPIAVMSQTPNVCSEIVQALIALIAPLRYGADYRPFFTIHDSEFKEYTTHTKSPPPVILGVTNPFFVKTLHDWPHLIKINELPQSSTTSNDLDSNPVVMHNPQQTQKNGNLNLKKFSHTIDQVLKINSKSLDLKTGVYTKYKPFLQKDRDILKKLLKGIDTNRPSEVQNAMLRRFLIELTQSFSIPLERYFASLMPLAKNLSPFKRPPILQHFKIEEFINSLEATGPHLTSMVKGDWNGLYRRFLRSPNFVCWYSSRLNEATQKIQSLHIETICDSNLANLLNDKQEIEIVDLILKLKDNINCATNGQLDISKEMIEKLQKNMDQIIDKLPEDSRSLFINNCSKYVTSTTSTIKSTMNNGGQ